MKVSPVPSVNLNKNHNFINFGKRDFVKNPPTKQEIETAKIKKIVSEFSCIATGIALVYFAMKVNIRHNGWGRSVVEDKLNGDGLHKPANPIRGIDFRKFMSRFIEHA